MDTVRTGSPVPANRRNTNPVKFETDFLNSELGQSVTGLFSWHERRFPIVNSVPKSYFLLARVAV